MDYTNKKIFKDIYNYIVDLVDNNTVFRINNNEVITLIPLGRFLEDINNDYKKYYQKPHHVEYYNGKWKHKFF